jgi:hypothetical protein
MKGVLFTEFLEMVEERYSLAMVDRLLVGVELTTGGSYTAVGNYPAEEMHHLVEELSCATSRPVDELLREFGRYLMFNFVAGFPQYLGTSSSALEFLHHTEHYHLVEVRKLYPDSEMPSFACDASVPGRLVMEYRSPRGLADLAEGLILGCSEYFGERLRVEREDLSEGRSQHVRFTITKDEGAG